MLLTEAGGCREWTACSCCVGSAHSLPVSVVCSCTKCVDVLAPAGIASVWARPKIALGSLGVRRNGDSKPTVKLQL